MVDVAGTLRERLLAYSPERQAEVRSGLAELCASSPSGIGVNSVLNTLLATEEVGAERDELASAASVAAVGRIDWGAIFQRIFENLDWEKLIDIFISFLLKPEPLPPVTS